MIIILIHILRKYTGRRKHTKSQEKINYLLYQDEIELFAKNEKEWETLSRQGEYGVRI